MPSSHITSLRLYDIVRVGAMGSEQLVLATPSVACSDGGAGGARHTLAPKRKAGKKDVDLRPHTYVRTRGAKYRC